MERASGQERTLSDDALKAMLAYDWPGNVRELENCLDRAGALTTGPLINTEDLPSTIHSFVQTPESAESSARILPMAELEKQTILNTTTHLNGDKLMAARLLGIGKTTLYRKLKEYACAPQ
jgi:two-component system response regulator HydG